MEVDDAYICPLSGILMLGSACTPEQCDHCGWNPKVHAERVARLQRYGPHALQELWAQDIHKKEDKR